MEKNLGDYVLTARESRSFAMLNAMVGIALSFEVVGDQLDIEIEGFVPCDGSEVSVPTRNSKMISVLSRNDTAFHSVGIKDSEADAVFAELSEAWASVEKVKITQTMNVHEGEDIVGTNSYITSGLTKNFVLTMGSVFTNYAAVGKASFITDDGYPDKTMHDTTLYARSQEKKEG